MRKPPLLWSALVTVGYGALLAAIVRYLDWPWNILVAALVLFKGAAFWAVTVRVRDFGGQQRRGQ